MKNTRRVKRNPNKIAKKLNITPQQCVEQFGPNLEKYVPSNDQEDTFDDYNENYIGCTGGMYQDWNVDRLDAYTAILTHYTGREESYHQWYYIYNLVESVFKPNYVLNGAIMSNSHRNENALFLLVVNNNDVQLNEVSPLAQHQFLECKECKQLFNVSPLFKVDISQLMEFVRKTASSCFCTYELFQSYYSNEKQWHIENTRKKNH